MPISHLLVRVDEINAEGSALCEDSFGRTHLIPTRTRRGKGALPAPGEYWVIDRSIDGVWTFAAATDVVLPTVVGEVEQDTAGDGLLAALAALGFINDEAERVEPGTTGGVNWGQWMNVSP